MKTVEQGVILKRINYSETSQIITLFTLNKGLKTYLFKGSKKKNAAIYPMHICEVVVYQRNDSQLGQLSECNSLGQTNHIATSPVKSLIAFFMADVILQCAQPETEDPDLYQFLTKWINALNQIDSVGIFPTLFLSKLISHLGYTPDVRDDARSFDIKNGEFIPYERMDGYCVYGEECQALLNLFQDRPFDSSLRKKTLQILIDYCTIHLPKFDVKKSLEIVTTVLYD